MREVTEQSQDCDGCVSVQSSGKSDGDQQGEEFGRRNLEDVEHRVLRVGKRMGRSKSDP